MSRPLIDVIRRSYRPLVAHRHVAAISQYHRIQASPGYRAAAGYVASQLASAGLEVAVQRYPANTQTSFWSLPSFQEWECTAARLELLDDAGQPVETLCDFAAIPTSLIQRSIPVEGDFEVALLAPDQGTRPVSHSASEGPDLPQGRPDLALRGDEPAAGDGAPDLAGKLVLTHNAPGELVDEVIRRRGAAGFLFDGMRAGGRTELDLPDARQYTSFWWAGPRRPDAFGFVLSPRQGQALRERVAERAAAGRPALRVRARIDSRFYDGEMEVVEAFIPGREQAAGEAAGDSEVLLVAHLCHPQPGAHDNGSGSAALMETVETLARLIADGELPRPRRGIRCLWLPEMTGTYAWLAQHEAEVRQRRWVAGLNLDMVGADQNQSGSVWELVDLPLAAAAFPDHLLAWLREPLLEGQRHSETAFSAGSDHYILSDPSVGIPTPMLNQWPDRFYHTSADTLEKVSPDSLGRSGVLAAAYAYWVATAGADEARWLGHWMLTRYAAQAGQLAAAAAEARRQSGDGDARAAGLRRYRRQSAFGAERLSAALASLLRLDPGLAAEVETLRGQVTEIASREAAWVVGLAGDGDGQSRPDAEAETWGPEAGAWVPARKCLGPVDVDRAVQLCAPELQQSWRRMAAGKGHELDELGALLLYWTDGRRTIAEIAGAANLEPNHEVPADFPLAYFKLLAGMELVELRQSPGARK